MKRRIEFAQEFFLLVQLVVFVFFLIQLGNHTNSVNVLLLVVSCLGLFVVAFSVFRIPDEKKKKITLLVIYCLSILSISLVVFLAIVQFMVQSMP
ncbi:hypothetical protein JTF06_07600 [Desemzia sp. RIT804]|uniref:hypothetical protein n=1 Tax=Desemzia sp. RIT 804 TaxID=2810209 RepID=UPI001951A7FF|nr:hypothetical protein [Desemzia sp. RIT 804]MBM6614754.1 hypothetical protein [Desemzia sp. RIT 804]